MVQKRSCPAAHPIPDRGNPRPSPHEVPTPPSPAPPSPIQEIIDPNGDLCLRVSTLADATNTRSNNNSNSNSNSNTTAPTASSQGQDQGQAQDRRDFRVCSATLRRTSPVWANILLGGPRPGGPWARAPGTVGVFVREEASGREGRRRVITLAGERPDAMAVLMAVAHGRCDLVPDADGDDAEGEGGMGTGLVYAVVVAAARYGMLGVLRPWVGGWVDAVCKRLAPRRQGVVEVLQSVHVAWELGCERDLVDMGKAFVLALPLEEIKWLEGVAAHLAGQSIPCGPKGFFENVMTVRARFILNGVGFWMTVFERLDDVRYGVAPATVCQAPCNPEAQWEREACDDHIRSIILRHLGNRTETGGTVTTLHRYRYAPLMALLDDLMKIEEDLKLGDQWMNRHIACRPRLVNIHDLDSTAPNPTHEQSQWNNLLSVEDKKHLESRRKITRIHHKARSGTSWKDSGSAAL